MTIRNLQKAKLKTRALPFDLFDYPFDGVYPFDILKADFAQD